VAARRHSTETRAQVLDPLFAARWTADESSYRFLAFVGEDPLSGNQSPDTDFMFFPFFWFGRGPREEENYFAFFPLFGTIKTFAGFAEVSFFLFPLYYRAMKNITEPETYYSLTPFVGWVDGGPRDGSWHLLPLMGHWQYEGKYDKWSVLWPFIHWQRNDLDTTDPTRDVTVWPLFGVETGKRKHYYTFLWPFFRFRSQNYVGPTEAPYGRCTSATTTSALLPREHTGVRPPPSFPFYAHYAAPRSTGGNGSSLEVRGAQAGRIAALTSCRSHQKESSATRALIQRSLWPPSHRGRGDDLKVIALLPSTSSAAPDFEANWGPSRSSGNPDRRRRRDGAALSAS
jgi:hypothetical protein